MRKALALAAVALFAFSITACKKCSTCTVKDSYSETIYEAPESCGKTKKVEEYQAAVKTEWEAQNADYTVVCSDIE